MSAGAKFSLPNVVAGALSLTAALAWNEAAKAGIDAIYPRPDEGSFLATLSYAVIVTILIVIIFYSLKAATSEVKKVGNVFDATERQIMSGNAASPPGPSTR